MDGFWISPSNPNAEQGGGDLITPTHQTVDAQGPWAVFPNVDCAEAQGEVPLPHAILPLSAVKAIIAEAEGVVVDETGGEGDIHTKINKPAEETVAWEDLPIEDQNSLLVQFPKGGRTRTSYGVTTVPTAGQANFLEPQGQTVGFVPDNPLPLETPDETGGYSPVEPDTEDAPTI